MEEGKHIRKSMESESDNNINKHRKIMVLEPRTDRISQLPDEILHHILSFLPQNLVPKTLFLSKRWLNLSTTLPSLSFEFRHCSETNSSLINFVNKLLSCREKSTIIEKFCLSCSDSNYCFDMDPVNGWIRDVVLRHDVRELDLNIKHNKVQFCSTFAVFCKSLTSLKLSFVDPYEKPDLKPNFPAFFSFPNLKTMHLKHVLLRTNFAYQLINCPKLENLDIDLCTFGDNEKNSISYDDSSLTTLPNLLNVSIFLHSLWDEIYVFDILRMISNVEVLSLWISCPTYLHEKLPEMNYFSKFRNLKVLEFEQVLEIKIGVSFMDGMLRSLPSLEYLNIGCIMYENEYEGGSAHLPSCRLSEPLKVVWIGRIFPDKLIIKIKLVKYFLEEAKGLEKMIVNTQKLLNQEELDFFRQALHDLPNIGALELRE